MIARTLTKLWWYWTGEPPTAMALCSTAVGVLHDEFVQTDDASSISMEPASETHLYQSWQSGADPRVVSGVCFRMQKVGSPTGTLKAAIYAHTGTYGSSSEPTGSALVESNNYDLTGIDGDDETNYFLTLAGWTPAASTNYCLVLDGDAIVGDGSNYVKVIAEDGAAATHGGNQGESNDSGSTWVVSGNQDLAFKLYYEAIAEAGAAEALRNNRVARAAR